MDTSLITAIIKRVKAHYEAEYVRMIVNEDESWHVNINKPNDDDTRTVASGVDFSELPAYLSTLK